MKSLQTENITKMENFKIGNYSASYNKETGELVVYSIQRKGHILRPCITNSGYRHYNLRIDGKSKNMDAHRIIGQQFIPNPDDKPEIDHINRDRQDNRLINLRWATRSENQRNNGGKCYSFHKKNGKWQVDIRGKYVGIYETEEEAKQRVEEIKAQI